jgi:hypothetical protein
MTTDQKKQLIEEYRKYLLSREYGSSWIGVLLYWVRLYLASDLPLTETATTMWLTTLADLGVRGRNRSDSKKSIRLFLAFITGNPERIKTKKGKYVCNMDCFNCPYDDCKL